MNAPSSSNDHSLNDHSLKSEPADFSLVLGGPLYQLWRRSRLVDDDLGLPGRRVTLMVALAWVPLLVLSILQGLAWGDGVKLPFLYDVDMHVRLLVALPLLILAELSVHARMRSMTRQFVNRGLIPDKALAQFDAAIASAMRLRNSITAEVLLIAFVYVIGVGFFWRTQVAVDVTNWAGVSRAEGVHLSLAGWWMVCISLPVFQFLLLRWYFRLFIWARFLWQVSRIDLRLMPMHPDCCGGVGFLSSASKAFVPVLVAQGALLAGMMANRIFYADASFTDFKVELVGIVFVMVAAVLGPLLVFSPKLEAARRLGLREYGVFAQRYVREFDAKWLHGATPDEPLIGSADIQSLADLGNSFEVVKRMRWVPFNVQSMTQLVVATLLPVLPLTLTMIPLEEAVTRLLKVIF